MLEFKLGGLCMKPLKDGSFIAPRVWMLKDLEVPLMLLCMSQQVIDVAGNGGLA